MSQQIINSIIEGMPDLKVNEYYEFMVFFRNIINHNSLDDMNMKKIKSKYNVDSKVINLAILFDNVRLKELPDLSFVRIFTDKYSIISNEVCRKNDFYLNFSFTLEEIPEILGKLSNLDKSELITNKFKL